MTVCKRKARYPTAEVAEGHARQLNAARNGDRVRVYECPECAGFHLARWTWSKLYFANREAAKCVPAQVNHLKEKT